MPYLLYWFDATTSLDPNDCVTLEPCAEFQTFAEGEALGLDQIPKHIQQTLLSTRGLLARSADDQRVLDALGNMQTAVAAGAPLPFVRPLPDHELFTVIIPTTTTTTSDAATATPMTTNERPAVVAAADTTPPEYQTPNNAVDGSIEMSARAAQSTKNGVVVMPVVGDRVSIYWEGMKQYYDGSVVSIRNVDFYKIHYDDNDEDWLPLREHTFRILPQRPPTATTDNFPTTPAMKQGGLSFHRGRVQGLSTLHGGKCTKAETETDTTVDDEDDTDWDASDESIKKKSTTSHTLSSTTSSSSTTITIQRA